MLLGLREVLCFLGVYGRLREASSSWPCIETVESARVRLQAERRYEDARPPNRGRVVT